MAGVMTLLCSLTALGVLAPLGDAARGKARASVHSKQIPGTADDYEYGDKESHESSADASDFSMHQFMVDDDARDGAGSTGSDNGAMEMARAKALKAQDHFGSEDTPDRTDSFVQTGRGKHTLKLRQIPGTADDYEYGDRESHESSADASDFSMHQFMVDDDARDGAGSTGNDNGAMEMARAKALKAQDHFGSEDTPDRSDSFVQTARGKRARKLKQIPGTADDYEYGDKESHESSADASDFSMHQFMVDDDARDGAGSTGNDNGAMEMARAKALKAQDHFGSEDTPDNTDSFVQTARGKRTGRKQIPGSGDEYEYGDKESHESSADASDFSMHQFMVDDDARDGAGSTGNDNGAMEMARAKALKAQDHFGSEDTPDNTDSFVQTARGKRAGRRKQIPGTADEYEYGDKESHESSADASDFSMHQFMVDDDARDGAGSTGNDNGAMEMARAKALKAQDHFGSEDTPDRTDSFVQTGRGKRASKLRQIPGTADDYEYGDKESHESSADASDFSMHQFMVDDDARDGAGSTGNDNGAMEMARAKALKAQDHFGSEDTPDNTDSFVQTGRGKRAGKRAGKLRQIPGSADDYEYGDKESHESSADASDFSMHQFMVDDDARDGAGSTGNDNGAMEMARAKALKAQDHFGSEDTPDNTDSFVQTGRGKRAGKRRQIPGSADEYEYGDKESHESSADASDFSMHQFMVDDDARDGAGSTGNDNGAMEMARAKALKAQDHFGSEDTPDNTDSFVQTGRKARQHRRA